MNKILITGGAGFIASALAESLAFNKDNFIVIADNLSTGSKEKLPVSKHNNIKFIKCNVNKISEITSVFHAFAFDYVFHYAALVGVKRTLQNPVKVLQDIAGIKNILNLSKNTGVKRVYYSSSSEVYGEPVEIPQNEDTTPLNSRLPYAIVKNVGEAFLKAYKTEFDLDYTVFRFFNTYGPKQSRDFVVSKFIKSAVLNEPITIYGNGSQTRTFCFISDNIDVTTKIFDENKCVNEVINIGNNIETTILDLAKLIIKLTNSKSEILFLPPLEEGDMSRRCPDNSKMREILNRELIPLEQGINKILENTKYIL
jgi:UDP-glucose 4-epimerase